MEHRRTMVMYRALPSHECVVDEGIRSVYVQYIYIYIYSHTERGNPLRRTFPEWRWSEVSALVWQGYISSQDVLFYIRVWHSRFMRWESEKYHVKALRSGHVKAHQKRGRELITDSTWESGSLIRDGMAKIPIIQHSPFN